MTMTSNLEENEQNDFKGQFEEGEDYGLPQLDFSPLDPLEFNEISSKPVSSKYLIDEETQTYPDAKEPTPSPSVKIDEKSAYKHQAGGNKKLKLVLPCKNEKDLNDNIIKEYLAYKLYEIISPYHFQTRLVDIQFREVKGKKAKDFELKGFLIEDDKKVAKFHDGKVFERFIHPLAMDADTSVQNALFKFMIGNTDFSVAYQHNGKLLYIDKKILQ